MKQTKNYLISRSPLYQLSSKTKLAELLGVSASTQVPYKPQPISKENLHGLRYVPNFDKGSR